MNRIDFTLLFVVVLLTLFGILMIYDASSYVAFRDFGDKYHYLRDQSLWMALGILGLLFFSLFDYRKLYPLSVPILLFAIFLLVLVYVPGIGVNVLGARRWITSGFFTIQPAEFAKLALAIYLSAWFSHKEKGRLFPFLLLVGLILLFIMLEPDMGTAAIILFEALTVYFISGGSLLPLAILLPVIGYGGYILIKLVPYRAERLSSFLNVHKDIESVSYHAKQILIALGMGGATGVGIGNSLQKYAYLPETATDSIFAIVAEEFGFLGSTILILFFAILIWRGFVIANRVKDVFGKLLGCAIISFLGIQIFINLGAQTLLVPLTGVPLPFVSYGGSALIINLCAVGILLNISKQKGSA